MVDGFGQRHSAQPCAAKTLQQRRQHVEDHRTLGARAGGVAVVQQHDVAGGKIPGQVLQHALRIALHGVEAAPGPAHEREIEALQHRREERVAQPGRRALLA